MCILQIGRELEGCGPCKWSLATSSRKNKRKKLYGKEANKSRDVLEKICREEIDAELNELPGICNGDYYLCYLCNKELIQVPKLEKNCLT